MTQTGGVLTVMSTLGVFGPLSTRIGPAFEHASGRTLSIRYDPTGVLLRAVAAGERADVMVAIDSALAPLFDGGMLDRGSRTPIASSRVGLAVRDGVPDPDIATPDALVRTLREARSIAVSRAGASGVFFAGLIARLGIAAEIEAKSVVIPDGFTAERLHAGEADLAVQQLSELRAVPGTRIVGAFPEPHQEVSLFVAARFAETERRAGADAFIAALATPDAAAAFAAAGLDPP